MSKKTVGFVALQTLRQGPPDPDAALAEIRRIYFKTSRQTIEHDIAHAIELLRGLPDEEQRERATVYMEGLAQMRKEWASPKRPQAAKAGAKTTPKATPPKQPKVAKAGRN